ncbi:MAG: DUF615 domain-containing protein [Gammaproteobacteria bacterium]|nr:DUF615 domain-containing protein [Gammaproteobacteria bacterium]
MIDEDDFLNEDDDWVSKSQKKRDAKELHALGIELTTLDTHSLAKIDMPDDIAEAIQEARRLNKKHGARKRQLLYIEKLFRHADVTDIIRQVDNLKHSLKKEVDQHHHLEQWRDRLIQEDDHTMTEFLNEYPSINRQELRQLIRNAKKEATLKKPPKYSRALFQFLKGNIH